MSIGRNARGCARSPAGEDVEPQMIRAIRWLDSPTCARSTHLKLQERVPHLLLHAQRVYRDRRAETRMRVLMNTAAVLLVPDELPGFAIYAELSLGRLAIGSRSQSIRPSTASSACLLGMSHDLWVVPGTSLSSRRSRRNESAQLH
jgi:hypothetical protein